MNKEPLNVAESNCQTRPAVDKRESIVNKIIFDWSEGNVAKLSTETLCTLGIRESDQVLQYCYVNLVFEDKMKREKIVFYQRKISWYFERIAMAIGWKNLHPQTRTESVSFLMKNTEGNEVRLKNTTWQHSLSQMSPVDVATILNDIIRLAFSTLLKRVESEIDKQWAQTAQEDLWLMCRNVFQMMYTVKNISNIAFDIFQLELNISDCSEKYKDVFFANRFNFMK